jgi:tripartite-type tricarboxylate transporter receptor subunit TctC
LIEFAKEHNIMNFRIIYGLAAIVGLLLWISPATTLLLGSPDVLAADYYAGKNIRFIVGFAAGGGYDAYTRTVARYIGRHIPGNPSTTVENMERLSFTVRKKKES